MLSLLSIVSANDLELAIYKSMLAGMKLHYEEFDKRGFRMKEWVSWID